MARPSTDESGSMQDCIAHCDDCHRACIAALVYCLGRGGDHAEASHVRLLRDCAQTCSTSADSMLRGSDAHRGTLRACAEICERCAEDCDRFENDQEMEECARICRTCAESCLRMAETLAS